MGVELALGETVSGLDGFDSPRLDTSGREILFPVIGARPAPPPIPGLSLSASGRAVVDAHLRAEGHRSVFVVGDAAQTGDPMTIYYAYRQAAWMRKTLKAIVAGRDLAGLRAYAPAVAPVLFAPLGPQAGAGVLPVTRAGWWAHA
jgi:hypothetical protein